MILVRSPARGNPEERSQKAEGLISFRLYRAVHNPASGLGKMLLISGGKNTGNKCGIWGAEQGPHKGKADPDTLQRGQVSLPAQSSDHSAPWMRRMEVIAQLNVEPKVKI